MQKVEGSSPFIRFEKALETARFLLAIWRHVPDASQNAQFECARGGAIVSAVSHTADLRHDQYCAEVGHGESGVVLIEKPCRLRGVSEVELVAVGHRDLTRI